MKFEISEKDYRTAVTNLAVAEARGQEITRMHALLLSIVGKEWDRTTPVPSGRTQDEMDYVSEKNRELAVELDVARRKISELLKGKKYLDEVCEILTLENPKRPVTYDEVPAIVQACVAHRDSAREKCEHLQKDVRVLQKTCGERASAAKSLERSVTRMAKNMDAMFESAQVVVKDAIAAYGDKPPPEGTPMGRLHEAVQCMLNLRGVDSR